MQRRAIGSCSNPWAEEPPLKYGDRTAWQEASKSTKASRKLKERGPNEAEKLEEMDPACKAIQDTKSSTEASEMRFRIPKASTGFAARLNRPQLDVSNLRGKKWQAFATQTMQDVISPKAFEQWTKDRTIPKTPNDSWLASDMRKAHTFKKRQWKLSKPEYKSLKLDTGSSIASHQQSRRKDATHRAKQTPTPKSAGKEEGGEPYRAMTLSEKR